MNPEASAAHRLFRFLGKVQFTMLLLIVGGIAMAAGTIIESRYGTEAAQSGVYYTWLFDLYLFLIVVNLVVAVINRIPIQRKQWAFVLTHSSIVLLLFGAWISRTYGVEGKLGLREGDSLARMTMDVGQLEVQWGGGSKQQILLGRQPRPGFLAASGEAHPRLELLGYEADAEYNVALVDAAQDRGPGVQIHVDGSGRHWNEWLLGDHRFFRRKDLGPMEVALLVARSEKALQAWLPELDSPEVMLRLRVRPDEDPKEFRLPADLGKEFELEKGLKLRLSSYLKHARVDAHGKSGSVLEDPKGPINPAVVFTVHSGDRTETHTVFSQFPEFNAVVGREGSPLLTEATLSSSDVGDKPLVRIIAHPESGRHWVQLAASMGRGQAHPMTKGKTVVLGNLGYEITLQKSLPHARPEVSLTRAEKPGTGSKWVRIQVGEAESKQEAWVRYRSSRTVSVAGKGLSLAYVPYEHTLPFEVKLEQVKADYHPGSQRASQYSSRVRIQGPGGLSVSETISMNRPLDHAGYRLFQSGFSPARDGVPAMTWLAVSYDPGVPWVYAAFIALILGVAWYVKNNPVQRGSDRERT